MKKSSSITWSVLGVVVLAAVGAGAFYAGRSTALDNSGPGGQRTAVEIDGMTVRLCSRPAQVSLT